jgi:hypothetical protein
MGTTNPLRLTLARSPNAARVVRRACGAHPALVLSGGRAFRVVSRRRRGCGPGRVRRDRRRSLKSARSGAQPPCRSRSRPRRRRPPRARVAATHRPELARPRRTSGKSRRGSCPLRARHARPRNVPLLLLASARVEDLTGPRAQCGDLRRAPSQLAASRVRLLRSGRSLRSGLRARPEGEKKPIGAGTSPRWY